MVEHDVDSAEVGDMSNAVKDFSVDTKEIDSPDGTKEFSYRNSKFNQQMGYLDQIPELAGTIKAMGKWTVGKGSKGSKEILDQIRGNGKQSFNEVIKNCIKMYMSTGDAFCEIIRDKTALEKVQNVASKITLGLIRYAAGSGKLLNLKPLNAGKMETFADSKGMISRYLYHMGNKEDPVPFKPNELFHLSWDVIGDQFHGTSIITRLETIILARNEAMDDLKTVFHRYVKPLWVWKLNTDNVTKIGKFKAKADKLTASGENLFLPKQVAEAERLSIPQFSTLDPLPWIEALNSYFHQATNVPDVILGSAKQTVEASAKMLVFAFEQSVQEHQLFLEEQIKLQLGLDVDFEFPASIAQELVSDNEKDGKPKASKPSDTKAKVAGKT